MNEFEKVMVTESVAARPVRDVRREKLLRALKVLAVVAFFAIAAVIIAVQFSGEDTGFRSAPPQLIGTWVSSHPEYSDRLLELTSDTITFGTGGTSFIRYSIIGVAVKEPEEGEEETESGEYFVIHFEGVDGARFRREILFEDSGTKMYFRSQPNVFWTRRDR